MADFMQRIGLQDKVAIIVGGGRGIGRACSFILAEAGANVVIVDIEASRAESVASEIRAMGRRSLPLAADVDDAATVERTIMATLDEFGQIDILVNNVGQSTFVAAEDMTEETWDANMVHNLKYAWRYCKGVAKIMMAQQKRCSIIN
ncbi:MAG: SDR family NAD(P)-dependent oxidoreductase, partial [Dehalococcoidia bacterium]